MSPVQQDILNRHLTELEETLTYLKTKQNVSEKEILSNYELRLAIERALHIAIQNIIEIGNHILASLGINDIETYADIPKKLAESKIIALPLANNLVNMAKFRNILVHDYIKLDTKKLVGFLKKNLSDFDEFAKAIVAWMKHA